MNVYMDELPHNCDCCPCNDDYYRCGLSGDLFDEHDIDIGRMKNCKLKRLADVRKNIKAQKMLAGGILDGTTHWYECSCCHGAVDILDAYCKHCGAVLELENDL